MKDFINLCKKIESLDEEKRKAIIQKKSKEILPSLQKLEEGRALELFSLFVLSSISSDGRIDEKEFEATLPILKLFLGENIDYNELKKTVRGMKKENRALIKLSQEFALAISTFSEDLREEIVLVVMLLCSLDGKITLREKLWIRSLLF